MALTPGQNLGHYQIQDKIGAGGMGEVYRALDPRLGRTVAIKVLPERTATGADHRERFQREAKAISSLSHPHICTLYDVGEQDGVEYLVMEHLAGETLAERLAKGPLPMAETLRFAVQIADALDSAHRQGLVHRDLKPGNVMITGDGAKLLDFGLAKLAADDAGEDSLSGLTLTTPLTVEGSLIGTMHYMSPEQLEGKEADARSDIFGFGAVLYEMATGKRPFEGTSQASLIASVLKEEPPAVSTVQPLVPPLLEQAIRQCLMKDPEQRWQTAGDLKRALTWVSEGGSQVGMPAPVARRRRRREVILGVLAVVMTVAAAGLGVVVLRSGGDAEPVIKSNVQLEDRSLLSDIAGGSVVLAPNGRMMVWSALDSMGTDSRLWVRRLDALAAVPLPGTESASFPFWSPDSRYVAYFAGGKLKKVLASGGPSLTLCSAPAGRGGAWNADGDILFTPEADGIIHRVSAAGGSPVPVTVRDTIAGDYGHRWVSFLPSGRDFLFFARTGSSSGGEQDAICVGSLDRPEIKRLILARSNAVFSAGHILFVRDGVLMAQAFSPGDWALSPDAVPVAESVSYIEGWSKAAFSATVDGLLAYRQGDIRMGSQLRLYDYTGAHLSDHDDTIIHYSVELSHEGSRAALNVSDQTNMSVWILDLDRDIRNRLTFEDANSLSPVWSPDDTRIAYALRDPERGGVYVKPANGAGEAVLVHGTTKRIFVRDWSPDGRYLCAAVQNESDDIVIIPVDGGEEPWTFLGTAADEYDPQFSPDGRWLAFTSEETGKEEVYVAAFPGPGGKWQVSLREGDRPRWKSDGQAIVYLDNSDVLNEAEIEIGGGAVKVGAVRPLFGVKAFRPGTIYDLSPDGRTIMVNERLGDQEVSRVVLVQNWPGSIVR